MDLFWFGLLPYEFNILNEIFPFFDLSFIISELDSAIIN